MLLGGIDPRLCIVPIGEVSPVNVMRGKSKALYSLLPFSKG